MDTASNVSASGAPAFNLVAGLVTWSLSVQSIRLGKDAYMAPDMVTRAASMRLSAQTTQDFKAVSTRSRELGVDALDNAQPFMGRWVITMSVLARLTGLSACFKTYLGMGCWATLRPMRFRCCPGAGSELAPYLDHRELDAFASASILGAAGSDPQLAARLGLWGRRVVGEEVGTFHAFWHVLGFSCRRRRPPATTTPCLLGRHPHEGPGPARMRLSA